MSNTLAHKPTPPSLAAMLCLYKNNVGSEVEEALRSAFDSQELAPVQLIVVFDGPVPDDVKEVINRFSENHNVKRIIHNECKGHGAARSAALNACEYEWIAIIDADDISMSNRFSSLLELAEAHPEAAVIGGGLIEFQLKNGERVLGSELSYPHSPADVRQYIAKRSPIAQPTSILRVAAVKEVGNYQHWYNNEDYHLWIRLVAAGYELWNVPHSVLWFRTNSDLFARRGGFRYWLNEARLQVFSYHQGTTTIGKLFFGVLIRFIVQVVMTTQLRKLFYTKMLRKI
ncbi:MAG: glycosyltransferase [Paracoccaceae bacterium]